MNISCCNSGCYPCRICRGATGATGPRGATGATGGSDVTLIVQGAGGSTGTSDLTGGEALTFTSSDGSITATVSDSGGAVVDLTSNGLGALKYQTYEIPLGARNETFSVPIPEMADKNIIGIMSVAKDTSSDVHTIIPVPTVSPTDDRQEMAVWVDTDAQTANIQLGDWDRYGFTAEVTFIYT
jgi:hypothetical protein